MVARLQAFKALPAARWWRLALWLGLSASVLYVLWQEVQHQPHSWQALWQGPLHWQNLLQQPTFWLLLLLMPLNWGLEAAKWQHLLKPLGHLPPAHAFAGVLRGHSMGILLPRTVGSALGRLAWLPATWRPRATVALLTGQSLQTACTLLGGLWVWGYSPWQLLTAKALKPGQIQALLVLACLLLLATAALYLYKKGKTATYWQWFKQVPWGRAALLALLRQVVFTWQFVLALQLAGVQLPLSTLIAGVCWVFLAKSLIPALNVWSDLGVREFSALLFFSTLGVPAWPVVGASLMLWGINIMLPALAGLCMGPWLKSRQQTGACHV